jgi:hypothetical protein
MYTLSGHIYTVQPMTIFITIMCLSMDKLIDLAIQYPIKIAAKHYGMSTTMFKIECRRLKLEHWPYRSLRAVFALKNASEISCKDQELIAELLCQFKAEPLKVDVKPDWLLVLRAKVYKARNRKICSARAKPEAGLFVKSPPWYLLVDVSVTAFDEPFYQLS